MGVGHWAILCVPGALSLLLLLFFLKGSGLALAGAGFGKGTRKKVLKTVGKVARSGLGLVKAFGSNEQKAQASQAEEAYNIVKGAGGAPKKPATKLRKMMF